MPRNKNCTNSSQKKKHLTTTIKNHPKKKNKIAQILAKNAPNTTTEKLCQEKNAQIQAKKKHQNTTTEKICQEKKCTNSSQKGSIILLHVKKKKCTNWSQRYT